MSVFRSGRQQGIDVIAALIELQRSSSRGCCPA
jgi:hypothetical protein